MKLFITTIVSAIILIVLKMLGLSSWPIWIGLIIFWMALDYWFYLSPFKWKDYIILIILLSIFEILIQNKIYESLF